MSRRHTLVISALCFCLALLATASSAFALVPRVVTDNVDDVAEYTYRSGGTGISGGTCGSTCSSFWNTQQAAPPNASPAATKLVNGQLVELDRAAKTLPKASLLGRISLGASAFSLGVWIGDLINDKFLQVGGPAAPASGTYSSFSLVWKDKGAGLSDLTTAPQDGFYLEGMPGFITAFKRWGRTEGSCSNLDPQPSEYLDFKVGEDACWLGGGNYGWRELHAYVYDTPFETLAPIEDYGSQSYDVRIGDWPDEPTTMSELETRVDDIVGEENLPLANAFFAHVLDPENYPDPRITDEENDHRCDRTPGPQYSNPGGNVDPDPFDRHIATPFSITNRPSGYGGVDVYLHEGTTYWVPGFDPRTNPWYVDDWGGWGYRHIIAKHGWGDTDLEETELALASAIPDQQGGTTRYLYSQSLRTPGDGGVSCIREVVVDFEAGFGDPRPRGIVTSFNRVVE